MRLTECVCFKKMVKNAKRDENIRIEARIKRRKKKKKKNE